MAEYQTDRLAMLLSSEWFLPYWYLVGIVGDAQQQRLFQTSCRRIVKDFMSGADRYWDIDFGSGRIETTRSVFSEELRKCKLEGNLIDDINSSLCNEGSPIDDGTRWLLVSMTEHLIQDSDVERPALDPAIVEVLKGGLRKSADLDLRYLSLTSADHWDQYLRGITPDLPAMLGDYALSVADQRKFEVLWRLIHTRLNFSQRRELMAWFRRFGQSLTGEPVRLAEPT